MKVVSIDEKKSERTQKAIKEYITNNSGEIEGIMAVVKHKDGTYMPMIVGIEVTDMTYMKELLTIVIQDVIMSDGEEDFDTSS